MADRISSLDYGPHQFDISNPRASNSMTTNIHGQGNTNVGNVLHSFNNILNVQEDSSWIQAWLSPLEPHRKHREVSNRRVEGVGDWVLGRSEFETWSKGEDHVVNRTLLCYGGPGVGKTYISSLVIDTLCSQPPRRNIAVLGIYCDYQARSDQFPVNMIGGLLKQITSPEIRSAFDQSRQKGGQGLRMPDMLKLFVKVVSSLGRVYICVDAVDELLPKDRLEFLQALRQITENAPNTRLFLTSRPYISAEMDKHLMTSPYVIKVVAHQGDIARYLNYRMENDPELDLMPESLRKDIMKTILNKASEASEMFLFVALNIDAILGETSLMMRKKMLRQVAATGTDLGSVYAQTLQRIKDQKGDRSKLGMQVLMWVSHSERPLRVNELRHALAVEMEETYLASDHIRSEYIVLGSCLGLAVVDQETLTVRPIHYTLQEYLSQPDILPDSHKTLAERCLAYLNYEEVKRLPANWIPNPRDMPFFEYSAIYWGSHAKKGLSDRGKSLALRLLTKYDNHVSALLLFNQTQSYDSPPITDHLFSGLHCASYFGIAEVVATLIETEGCDVNQKDCKGFTPLMWAERRDNEAVVKLLLAWDDVNPDKPDNHGQKNTTPASFLGWALRGCETLLPRDHISSDKPDSRGGALLLWALLGRADADHGKPDNIVRTPLPIAHTDEYRESGATGTSSVD